MTEPGPDAYNATLNLGGAFGGVFPLVTGVGPWWSLAVTVPVAVGMGWVAGWREVVQRRRPFG